MSAARPVLRYFSSGSPQPYVNWPQIGRGIEAVKSDLGDGFFNFRRQGIVGLRDTSVFHPNVTFSDPFHYVTPNSTGASSSTNGAISHRKDHNVPDHAGHKNPLLESFPPIIANALPMPVMHVHGKSFGRGRYLVRGRFAYTCLVALVRMGLKLYYDDAGLEIVRCRSVVGGPLRATDLDDDYTRKGGVTGSDGKGEDEKVWRRQRNTEAGSDEIRDDSVRLVVRWMFEGTRRHSLYYASIFTPLNLPQPTVYEGVFVYTFDNESGLIANHRLESMSPTPWVPAICKWWIERKARAKSEGAGAGDGLPQLNSSDPRRV